MPRGKNLSIMEKCQINSLLAQSLPMLQIARQINRSFTVVRNYIKNPEKYGQKNNHGRKRATSPRTDRRIIRKVSNNMVSCSEIHDQMNLKVTPRTVLNIIHRSPEIKFRKCMRKPPLKQQHIKARLEWAMQAIENRVDWNVITFSDEKKFNLDGPDGFGYYWHDLRKESILFSKRHTGGGSLMVWAAFSSSGKTEICFVEGRMNAAKYQDILENYLLPSYEDLGGERMLFVQDNCPVHKAKSTMDWFAVNNIPLFCHPPLSPDLNPIENIWGILVRRVYANGRQFQTSQELRKSISDEWSNLTHEELTPLIESMPRRVAAVIYAHGRHTKY